MRDQDRPDALDLLFVAFVLYACVWMMGCAHAYVQSPAPTPQSQAAVLAIPVAQEMPPADAPFEVRVFPRFIFAGGAVRLTCHVPERYGSGRIRLALEGIQATERSLDRTQTILLVERVSCGTWTVTCTIRTPDGEQRLESELESRGECNSGTSLAEGQEQ